MEGQVRRALRPGAVGSVGWSVRFDLVVPHSLYGVRRDWLCSLPSVRCPGGKRAGFARAAAGLDLFALDLKGEDTSCLFAFPPFPPIEEAAKGRLS